jgi:hypothetical protein
MSATLNEDIRKRVDALARQIEAGEVEVPTTWNGSEFPNPP